ncbi:MAG: hypothetical protein RSF93_01465 [Mucinivorans sp.]
MKSTKEFSKSTSEDTVRRASKLDPMRRSGKERHYLLKSLDSTSDDDELDEDYLPPKRESVLDYLDDEEN